MTYQTLKAQFIFLCLGMLSPIAFSQDLNLPLKSPKASTSYSVGYTEIKVNYGSPAIRDRYIWGAQVPYDEVWRAGANEATTISFSTEINIEGQVLEAGKYSFFLIPKQGDKWTAIFNSETDIWGAFQYKKEHDVARIEVPVKFVNVSQERLSYEIIDQNSEQGYIKLTWGKARVYVRFLVDVVNEAMAQVDAALESAEPSQQWIIYARGADFLLETGKQIDQAMEWADMSSELKANSLTWWVKARALAGKEMYRDAIESGKKAIQLGKASPKDTYYQANSSQIKSQMEAWVNQVNGTE